MRLLHTFAAFLLLATALHANHITSETKQAFIDQLLPYAVQQKKEHGIPTSLTIAQAIHETNWGQSDLYRNANNLFGIKCKGNWQGRTYYKMDDDPTESCFRAYSSFKESIEDRSVFLKTNARYDVLFTLEANDYRSWAAWLQEKGYATAHGYADKLIQTVEENGLQLYDYSEPVSGVMPTPTPTYNNTIKPSPVQPSQQENPAENWQPAPAINATPSLENGAASYVPNYETPATGRSMEAPSYRINGMVRNQTVPVPVQKVEPVTSARPIRQRVSKPLFPAPESHYQMR